MVGIFSLLWLFIVSGLFSKSFVSGSFGTSLCSYGTTYSGGGFTIDSFYSVPCPFQ